MNCNVIKDLMVLYASGECSDESKALIREHVETCPGCRAIWTSIESDELTAVVETEKETEFQQVTKEIKKRNWRKIFKRTVACTLILALVLSTAGIMYIRWDNAGHCNVFTGNIVYWNEEEPRTEGDAVFTYQGQDYIALSPTQGEIGDQLFDGNAQEYLGVGTCWEDISKDRSKAAFNVQSEWASPWADLILENNRVTLYTVGSDVEENMYICTRFGYVYVPMESKGKVLDYYNDEANYTWTVSEFIDVPLSDPNPEEHTVERDDIPVTLTREDVKDMKTMFALEETVAINEEEALDLHYIRLSMTSKDGVLRASMGLKKIDGQWSAIGEEEQTGPNEYYYTSLKLPKSIGDKIDAALAQ